MEIGMETIDNRVTKGTFGEDERRPAGFGIGLEGVGMFWSITPDESVQKPYSN